MMRKNFTASDVEIILQIPLGMMISEDKQIGNVLNLGVSL